ncbi:hypothetical protein SCA6_007112 [Theobroma cacao]
MCRKYGFILEDLNKAKAMALLFKEQAKLSAYRDRKFSGTQEEFEQALLNSTTVYIGNMSFYTTEEQVYELFSRAGEIKKIIMGLDKNSKTPCGFCFVLYYSREDTEDAVKYISGTILDDRPIRVDFDWGFVEGRQWGRGRSGGQVSSFVVPAILLVSDQMHILRKTRIVLAFGIGTSCFGLVKDDWDAVAKVLFLMYEFNLVFFIFMQVRDEYRTDYDPDILLASILI